MRAEISTDLLLRLMSATPEQYAAVERILGVKAETLKAEMLKGKPVVSENARRTVNEDVGRRAFVLRKELGNWSLVFDGQRAVLHDCRAIQLVDYLLKHLPEVALHASELENLVDGSPLLAGFRGIGRAEDEGRAAVEAGEVGGVIEERTGRNFVGGITLPALKSKLAELRAARDDETLPEDERRAAEEELSALLRAHARGGRLTGEAGRAVDRVRKQIKALIRNLKSADPRPGIANEVLRAFGEHLENHLWLPSVGGRRRLGAAGRAGCFTYEPPAGVRWRD